MDNIHKCIYMLISPSKKCYIGKTICLKNRFRQHRTPKKNTDGRAIYKALKKYGWDNFLKVIIEVFDDDVSNEYIFERETYWIKYHGSLGPKGYNCTKGGAHPEELYHPKRVQNSVPRQRRLGVLVQKCSHITRNE